jgi:hypothetical protein
MQKGKVDVHNINIFRQRMYMPNGRVRGEFPKFKPREKDLVDLKTKEGRQRFLNLLGVKKAHNKAFEKKLYDS